MDESIAPRPNDGFISSPSPPSPPSSPSSPNAASLYGIAQRHSRERILVQPLRWTSRHLELLRISFDEPSPAPNIEITDCYKGPAAPEETRLEYLLQRFHLLKSREDYFGALLCCGSPISFFWADFHIALNRPSINLLSSPAPCEGICFSMPRAQWPDPEYPIGAYIDRERIAELRKESLHFHMCNPQNAPVYSMLNHKLEQLRPTNPFKDPYIAALLIAVAQERRSILRAEKPEDLSTLAIYPSQVLYSSESRDYIHLYKADIPCSFLDMLDYPKIAPPEVPRILIQAFKIPRTPVGTFRDRILALVLQTTSDHSIKSEN
ncbi:uncharacterized protein TrAtP1_005556 [Trichoderma atroviride]|uniref:uncharacterized protein n=1 Tax=Hypocrea atroviridis TaxID=63577 RepID=UPI00332D182D|nr:hypothetical protein TrAtP1_005556 [Trichoderma atroviride]